MIRTGGPGPDTLKGTSADDELSGLGGNDTLLGRSGSDWLSGGDDDDRLTGGAGVDFVYGGSGNDTGIIAKSVETANGEIYDGGDGVDTIASLNEKAAITFAVGATFAGWENLLGYTFGLRLSAAQLNSFSGRIETGAVTFLNGGSVDLSGQLVLTSVFNLSSLGNSLNLATSSGAFTVYGGAGADSVFVEGNAAANMLFGNGGNDILKGGSVSDLLDGGAGNDILSGGSGDDKIYGGGGADSITAGDGRDVFKVTSASEVVNGDLFNGGGGRDTVDGTDFNGAVTFGKSAVFTGCENLIGFAGGLSLTSTQLASFTGLIQTGEITLSSGGTTDLTGANVGTSAFHLSDSDNHFILGDTLGGGATVHGGSKADQVEMVGEGWLEAFGNGGDDVLRAVGGTVGVTSNWLDGGEGNDILIGGVGNAMHGRAGRDSITAGDSLDVVYFHQSSDSTGPIFDTVIGFDMAEDRIAFWNNAVDGVQGHLTEGSLSLATFDENLQDALKFLPAFYATLFTPSGGDLADQTFLVVNTFGGIGYTPGGDLVVRLQDYQGSLTTENFWPL